MGLVFPWYIRNNYIGGIERGSLFQLEVSAKQSLRSVLQGSLMRGLFGYSLPFPPWYFFPFFYWGP